MYIPLKTQGNLPSLLIPIHSKKDQAFWVFLNAHELKAKEEVLCLISYPRNEG